MQSEQRYPSTGKRASLLKIVFFLAVCVVGSSLPKAVDANTFVCRGANGKMSLSQSPCSESSKYSPNRKSGKDSHRQKHSKARDRSNAVSRSSIRNSRKARRAGDQQATDRVKLGPATCKHLREEIAASYRRGVKVYGKDGEKIYRKDAKAMKHLREWEKSTRESCS